MNDVVDDVKKTVEKAAKDIEKAGKEAGRDIDKTMREAGRDIDKTIREAGRDTDKTLREAGRDIDKTMREAAEDSGKTIIKAVADVGGAGVSVYNFGVRYLADLDDVVDDTIERIGDGDPIGAMWHFSVDHVIKAQENLATASTESNIVQFAGQIVASSYGGPGGAAAYAAWLAYNQTEDIGLAIQVGLITGAASMATSKIVKMPNEEVSQIAKQTLLAGAVGGAAVAAAGGNSDDALKGFLSAGGSVMIQAIYQNVTSHELDPKISDGPPMCMAATNIFASCAPPREAYTWDENGKMVVDESGTPTVDIRKTDIRRPHVGTQVATMRSDFMGIGETNGFMVAVSKFPSVNAMSIPHDHISAIYKWDLATNIWTIVPFATATYFGTDFPTNNMIQETATENAADGK